jgi:hypothetical protein
VIVFGVLHDQMLLAILISCDHARLALVHSRPGTRPVALVARHLVLGEGEVADFEFA